MQPNRIAIPTGCVLSIPNMIDSGRWLGLVVDQSRCKKWVSQDLCLEYGPLAQKYGPLLVRVLGLRLTEGEALGKSSVPAHEPRKTETVRWAYIQTIPNPPFVVAGPDVESITRFLEHFRVCNSIGGKVPWSVYGDLALVEEYLRGVTREDSSQSFFEKQYFKMLADVLPRS